ncbi:hypothetical protein [Blastococcus sp. LR1]|uniref:hypothetical protein n=1 Tax=Blastococcus sp. LR1 TaxID=2877000 RepID=UPI001CC9F13E|nr:hypothetical protein [Blastococcus sp. LR1]MCA0144999.1 hypothetical protein [Blastococcus sp. LR1]
MTHLEQELPARLHDLADDLVGRGGTISVPDVVARHRQRRRARAGLMATVAAVVAVAVGIPVAAGSLSSAPSAPAAPAPATSDPREDAERAAAEARAELEAARRAAEASAAASRPDPAHEAELRQVAAGLPALSLSSPALWDQWLPEGKPYPGADAADDMSTCPVLSARLETVTGQQMSYWTGTLPNGPGGCTWVETPLSGQDNIYDYFISVGFLADGTTVEDFRMQREGPGQGTHFCPAVDVPWVADGALLVRCSTFHETRDTSYTLVLPDTRLDDGIWILSVSSEDTTPVRPAEILPVLVDGVVATFG